MDPKLEKAQKMAERRQQLEDEERNMEWGKGLVQKREREERLLELQREASKPFARYRVPPSPPHSPRSPPFLTPPFLTPPFLTPPFLTRLWLRRTVEDEDLNQAQRNAERWGDPMAAAAAAKRNAGTVERPKYRGPPPPPNRFNIPPGYRWDGVGKRASEPQSSTALRRTQTDTRPAPRTRGGGRARHRPIERV